MPHILASNKLENVLIERVMQGLWGYGIIQEKEELPLLGVKKELLFYLPPYTLVIWDDGTWTIVKTHNDPFDEEYGYAMAIARKFYGGNRSAFLKDVEGAVRGFEQED